MNHGVSIMIVSSKGPVRLACPDSLREEYSHQERPLGFGSLGALGVVSALSVALGVAVCACSMLPKECVMAPMLALGAALRRAVIRLGTGEQQRARAPAARPSSKPGRRGRGRGWPLLLLLVLAGLPGYAVAETPVPPGLWGVEGYPEGLSMHAQNGLTAVMRLQGVGVGSSGARWQFALGSVLADGTGFVAPLVDPGTIQDTGKRLSLVFNPNNPTRLVGTVTDGGTGTVERQFSATKIFPVSGYEALAFGDSITAGVGAQSSGGYPDILRNLLADQGLALGVTNAGAGGETAFNGASRLPVTLDASPIVPGIVLILEGINGLDADEDTIESTVLALLDMVAAVRTRGGLPILGTLTPVESPDTRGPAVDALNARIRQVAAEQGIRLADHHAAFGGNPGLLGEDGVHPNDQGYQVMAETWLAAILAAW